MKSMSWNNVPSIRSVVAIVSALSLVSAAGAGGPVPLPNQVASGDTTSSSSVLWARSLNAGAVTFEYSTDPSFGSIAGSVVSNVSDPTLPVKAPIAGLTPGTQYYYRATDSLGASSSGKFKTSHSGGFNGLRFGVSGDWRGELSPYPAVKNAVSRDLELWVGLGDTIYADVASPAVPIPQATTLAEYRAKHNEVYSSRFGSNTLGDIRSNMSVIAVIDDHEVTNDFAGGAAPSSDPRFTGQPGAYINETTLYQTGMQAFQEYNPVNNEFYGNTGDPRTANKLKLYRGRSYGKDAAMLTLDARSFRDQGLPGVANPTDPAQIGPFLVASFNPARTMLGNVQLSEMKADLLAAQANGVTWKFINVPEPIQNLGVLNASDRFEGYAAERTEILKFINDNNIQNVVFIAADIHGTLVNNLTYQTGPGQPQIASTAFEITTGSVAYDAPFGPTVAGIAASLGIPGALPLAVYNSLTAAQKEGYVQGLINAQIQPLGYDPIGLQGSNIPATLLQGGYSATNSFGWTEFDIDPNTQALTVTTWGIPSYTEAQLLANPSAISSLDPVIVSQFRVSAIPAPGAALIGVAGLVGLARRRRA